MELGCGTGLVSIACGAFGSQEVNAALGFQGCLRSVQVIATDGDTALLELTAHNISLNGISLIDTKLLIFRRCRDLCADTYCHVG